MNPIELPPEAAAIARLRRENDREVRGLRDEIRQLRSQRDARVVAMLPLAFYGSMLVVWTIGLTVGALLYWLVVVR